MGLLGEEELLGQCLVLEEEAVVGGYEDVGGVGVGGLLDQINQLGKCELGGFEDPALGAGLVANRVDDVVEDVQNSVALEHLPPLVCGQGPEGLGLDGAAAHGLKHLRARTYAVGGQFIGEHCLAVSGVLQSAVRQECGHAELGVARQNAENGIEVGGEPVLLADAGT